MTSKLDQAKEQFSAIQGTVNETFLGVKKETEANADKLKGQLKDLMSTAPQLLQNATRDIKGKAETSASTTAEAAKTEANNIATFFAGIFEKCCAPLSQKKD